MVGLSLERILLTDRRIRRILIRSDRSAYFSMIHCTWKKNRIEGMLRESSFFKYKHEINLKQGYKFDVWKYYSDYITCKQLQLKISKHFKIFQKKCPSQQFKMLLKVYESLSVTIYWFRNSNFSKIENMKNENGSVCVWLKLDFSFIVT